MDRERFNSINIKVDEGHYEKGRKITRRILSVILCIIMVVMMMLSIGETAKAALNSIMLNIGEQTTLRASIAIYNIIYSQL